VEDRLAFAHVGVQRPQRWDAPFDPEMTEAAVERLLAIEPFSRIDPGRFPASLPLQGILRNDARIQRYRRGDIVVREGDYGSSAFFVIGGALRVELEAGELPETLAGRSEARPRRWGSALAQLWRNSRWPESRRLAAGGAAVGVGARRDERDEVKIFLQDVPGVISRYRTKRIEPGEWVGELAALGRTPRTASVFAEDAAELLEIRWQGLRDIRSRAPEIKEHIDRLYRERSLEIHLVETPMFAHLGKAELGEVVRQVEFETYGHFDWYGPYRALAQRPPEERLRSEPVIAEEGHYPNGLILIRSGFARETQRYGHGERTVDYLGRGRVHGFETIAHNWRSEGELPLPTTLRAIGYVDVLRVPTAVVERFALPSLAPDELPPLLSGSGPRGPGFVAPEGPVEVEMLEFLVERRFINGTAAMLIDLDRCTRCDDCVRACAAAHDGNPRFVRHGPESGSVMVANACMHCADPVCMIGCPTGAIHRDRLGGQVVINDDTCIGCATCANSCPYDNIRMVEIRDEQGRPALDLETNAPIQKATKCDLCRDQLGGPACARACPHDALVRIDLTGLSDLAGWLER
jgi:Fe-S-cluster-containing dehydrogenase component/CRP-like cAMP-binding protein